MKKLLVCTGLACLLCGSLVTGQSSSTAPKTLASSMDVYVFPTEGQDAKQQSMDEAECYSWAVQNTGSDPFDLQKQAEQDMATAEQQKQAVEGSSAGAGAGGAVKGAAANNPKKSTRNMYLTNNELILGVEFENKFAAE